MKLAELDKITEADFDDTFNVNVKGPLFLAQVKSLLEYLRISQ